MPDVNAAVAIEIDAVLVVFGWEKLREPGRAGPGGAHVLAADGAFAEDLQREDELVAISILAAADIGLGCHHAHRVIGQRVAAVIGLATPYCEYDGAGYAETRFDCGKRIAILLHQLLPLARKARDGGFPDVVGWHLRTPPAPAHRLGVAPA